MSKSLLLILALALGSPLAVQAETLTLVPSVHIQVGDYDGHGHYWDGGRWRDREWWYHNYYRRDNHWYRHEARWHDHRPYGEPGPGWHGGWRR